MERVDGSTLAVARFHAGLTQARAAVVLAVTLRTLKKWETDGGPVHVLRFFQLMSGEGLPFEGWQGWLIRDGGLWSPANQFFSLSEVLALPLQYQRIAALEGAARIRPTNKEDIYNETIIDINDARRGLRDR